MAYLLDTNAVIALLKGHDSVVAHVRRVGLSQLWLCAPVEAELWFGVWKSAKPDENRRRLSALLAWLPSLPFGSEAAALLRPLVGAVRRHVLGGCALHADDTPVPVLAPGRGSTKQGRLWARVRDGRPCADPTPPAGGLVRLLPGPPGPAPPASPERVSGRAPRRRLRRVQRRV